MATKLGERLVCVWKVFSKLLPDINFFRISSELPLIFTGHGL